MKISTPAVIFFALLLGATSFYSGFAWNKLKTVSSAPVDTKNNVVFATSKSAKPELKFFVMSFCPYGNQIEDVLRPVYDLLKDKVTLTPQYIFDKVEDLSANCQQKFGSTVVAQCPTYVESITKSGNANAPFNTLAGCKKYFETNLNDCLNEKNYLKSSTGAVYSSLHGRQEANQNVREMCAYKLVDDKKVWWDFVANVNKNCTAQNADTCWEQQGKAAGLDTNKITECFNKEAFGLIEAQITETSKYKVSGSPTVLINGVLFPPEAGYTADNKGSLLIGKKVATQDKYRTPNVIKEAVCASMNKSTKECDTVLNELSGATPGPGACN